MDERLRSLVVAAKKDISMLPLVAAEECRMGNHRWREHNGNQSPLTRPKDSVDEVIDHIIKTQVGTAEAVKKEHVLCSFSLCICFWCGALQQRIFAFGDKAYLNVNFENGGLTDFASKSLVPQIGK